MLSSASFPRTGAATLLAALALLLSLLSGCNGAPEPPPLITATELLPQEAEVGDRLEVSGTGFPKGKTARLTFRGTLHRPGEAAEQADIDAEAVATSGQRVELTLGDPLRAAFCGRAERAAHTTFRGTVEVAFPAVTRGAPPVTATVLGAVLDLRPAPKATAELVRERAAAERVLSHMGLTVEPTALPGGGLRVAAVASGSRAEAAGIAPFDTLLSFDGVRIFGLEDVAPSGENVAATIVRQRAGAPDETVEVPVDGLRIAAPRSMLWAAVLLVSAACAVLLFVAPGFGFFAWWERRAAIALRAATGAALASPVPGWGAAAVAVSIGFALLSLGRHAVLAEVDVALVGIVTLGVIGAWRAAASGPKAAFASLAFGAPVAVAVGCVVLFAGSTRLYEVVRMQGGVPWGFNAFAHPLGTVLFALFAAAALTAPRAPSGLPVAEGPPAVPRASTLRERLAALLEEARLLAASLAAAALFLGAWRVPGLTLAEQNAKLSLELVGSFLFLAKTAIVYVVARIARDVVPPMTRTDALRLALRWLLPAAALAVPASWAWLVWGPSPAGQHVWGAITFAALLLAAVRFAHRLVFAARHPVTDVPTSALL